MSTDNVSLYDVLEFKVIRKALFLDYNHSVYNTIVYVPNTSIQTLLGIWYPNNKALHINFEVQESTDIITSDDVQFNVTYNNYNGLGKLTSKPACYGMSSKNLSIYENLSYSGVSGSSTYSGYMVLKATLPNWTSLRILSPVPELTLEWENNNNSLRIRNNSNWCGQYPSAYFPQNTWALIGWVTAGGNRMVYAKSLVPGAIASTAVAYCGSGTPQNPSSGTIFYESSVKNIDLQEFCIIGGLDLYAEGNNTFSEFDKLY
jgi:hypothetical protein